MKLADAGCLAFSEGLSRGTMLQTLLLMNQRISVDGIKSIAPTISKHTSPRSLKDSALSAAIARMD
jgi:hypothetical protein